MIRSEYVVRYQCWYNEDDHSDLFDDFDDAYAYAVENDCEEIEKLIWFSEDAYQCRCMADGFELAWRRA